MTSDYEEINLLDYMKVLIKRWRIIVIIPLITMLAALGYVVFLTSVLYQANAVIQIGQVSGNLIESKDQTKAKLFTEKTAKEILEQIQTKKLKEQFPITQAQIQSLIKTIKINGDANKDQPQKAQLENFLEISYQHPVPQTAKKVIDAFDNLILKKHQKEYDYKIKIRDENLAQTEKELGDAKQKLSQSEQMVQKMEKSTALYPTSYSEGSGNALASEIQARDALRAQASTLEKEILSLKQSQNYDKPSEIISPPLLPDTPIKYQKLSVTLMIALILGVFVGTLSAFGLEWWNKNSSKLKVQS